MKTVIVLLSLGISSVSLASQISFSGTPAFDAYQSLTGSNVVVDEAAGHVTKTGVSIQCSGPTNPTHKNSPSQYSCSIFIDENGNMGQPQ